MLKKERKQKNSAVYFTYLLKLYSIGCSCRPVYETRSTESRLNALISLTATFTYLNDNSG